MRLIMYMSLVVCLLIPMMAIGLELILGKKQILRTSFLSIYVLVIVCFTTFRLHYSNPPYINLTPFWSYVQFHNAAIRWQVYMNVFLFIPFGFMLPWCMERLRRLWKVILIAAVFSALTEAAQYFFRIGLCETDDVIHNTLGAVIGYGYWRLLSRIQHTRGDKK